MVPRAGSRQGRGVAGGRGGSFQGRAGLGGQKSHRKASPRRRGKKCAGLRSLCALFPSYVSARFAATPCCLLLRLNRGLGANCRVGHAMRLLLGIGRAW